MLLVFISLICLFVAPHASSYLQVPRLQRCDYGVPDRRPSARSGAAAHCRCAPQNALLHWRLGDVKPCNVAVTLQACVLETYASTGALLTCGIKPLGFYKPVCTWYMCLVSTSMVALGVCAWVLQAWLHLVYVLCFYNHGCTWYMCLVSISMVALGICVIYCCHFFNTRDIILPMVVCVMQRCRAERPHVPSHKRTSSLSEHVHLSRMDIHEVR